jgi:hypothetical protein
MSNHRAARPSTRYASLRMTRLGGFDRGALRRPLTMTNGSNTVSKHVRHYKHFKKA